MLLLARWLHQECLCALHGSSQVTNEHFQPAHSIHRKFHLTRTSSCAAVLPTGRNRASSDRLWTWSGRSRSLRSRSLLLFVSWELEISRVAIESLCSCLRYSSTGLVCWECTSGTLLFHASVKRVARLASRLARGDQELNDNALVPSRLHQARCVRSLRGTNSFHGWSPEPWTVIDNLCELLRPLLGRLTSVRASRKL